MKNSPLTWAIDVTALGTAPARFSYEAAPDELAALTDYLDVSAVRSFAASVRLKAAAGGKHHAEGEFRASIVQPSVVSLAPVASEIAESFSVEYWPREQIEAARDETGVVSADEPEPVEEGKIAVGKLLSELLALAIDPYPRNEGEEFEWASPEPDRADNPFAKLERLKRPKSGDGA